MTSTPHEQLLTHLHRGGKFAYYWTLEEKSSLWFPTNRPQPMIANSWKSRYNMYFGVHPTDIDRGSSARATIATVAAVNCFFAEFDAKDFAGGKAGALDRISNLPLQPSVIVDSGGGYHCYFLLRDTVHVDDNNREHIKSLQLAWVDFVGSDGGAKDLARVLRLPGTKNHKYPDKPTVQIITEDYDRLYDLSEFEQLTESIRANQQPAQPVQMSSTPPVSMGDQDLIDKMLDKWHRDDPAAVALWNGDISVAGDNHNGADQSLCNRLAFWTKDAAQIDRLFRQSRLYRPKWLDREDYRNRTIDKAIRDTPNTYDPTYRSKPGPTVGNPQSVVGNPTSSQTAGQSNGAGSSSAGSSANQQQTGNQQTGNSQQNQQQSNPTSKPNKATQIYELALKHCSIFQGDDGAVYATVRVNGHVENLNLRSARFRQWLGKKFYDETGNVAGTTTVKESIEVLSFQTGPVQPTFLRVGGTKTTSYIDLGNDSWEAIEIDSNGWRIVSNAPVVFRRTGKMKPLPTPVKVDDVDTVLKELFNLINVAPEDRILVLAWLLAAMRHTGPYPVITLIAEPGSAKTTTATALKRLISPYVAETRSRPKTVEDVYVAAQNDWILVYDNLSSIPIDISDAFCRLATGGGYATREFYENLEEVVIDQQQPLIVNGVTDVVKKGDLASRALTVSLPEITEDRRIEEAEWERRFADAHPRILGALCEMLSMIIDEMPNIKGPFPRMADFAKLGKALDVVIGTAGKPQGFIARYAESSRQTTMTVIENSTCYAPLWKFLNIHGEEWVGTSTGLLGELSKHASSIELFNLPKAGNSLSRELAQISTNLRATNIIDVRISRTKKGSLISVKRMASFDDGEPENTTSPNPIDTVPTP